MRRTIEMRLERNALFPDFAQAGQRHHLVAAGIGQDRARPVHEPMQPAQRRHPLRHAALRRSRRVTLRGDRREDPLREAAGGFEVLGIIHQLQGLQRSVAAFPPTAELLAIGGVKITHEGRGRRPFQEGINAAAVQSRAVILQVKPRVAVGISHRLPDVRRLVTVHALASLIHDGHYPHHEKTFVLPRARRET